MALNKKQREAVQQLARELAMSRALAWPTFPDPKPVPSPRSGEGESHGFTFNVYSLTVREVWQSSVCEYTRPEPVEPVGPGRSRGGSQTRGTMYASRDDAHRAMIHAVAKGYAETLAELYAKAGMPLAMLPELLGGEADAEGTR